MYTPAQAIQAMKARIDGVWDDEQLMKLGALLTDTNDDIRRILASTIDAPPERVHVIEVTYNNNQVILKSHYHNQISIPFNHEPGAIAAALDSAHRYLVANDFNIICRCAGKMVNNHRVSYLVSTTFKMLPEVKPA